MAYTNETKILNEIAIRVLGLGAQDIGDPANRKLKQALEEAFVAGATAQRLAVRPQPNPVDVETRLYRNAHGKDPRGFGCWVFQIGERGISFQVNQSTYGDAKKAAITEARKHKIQHVVVLS